MRLPNTFIPGLDLLENTPGIYALVNQLTHKLYVGSSGQVRKRVRGHLSELRRNHHRNRYLQRAWNAVGAQAFEVWLLEPCALDQLVDQEAGWIYRLQATHPEHGYNLDAYPQGQPGKVRSPETRAKMSAAKKGKTPAGWAAMQAVGRLTPMSDQERQRLIERNKEPWTPERRLQAGARKAKSYTLCSPTGDVLHITNLRAFCREHQLNSGAMGQVVLGKKPQYKGWTLFSTGYAYT